MIFTRNAQTNRFSRDCWWKNLQLRKIRFWCIAATMSRTGPEQTGGSTEKSNGVDMFVPNTANITASWTSPERWHTFIYHIKEKETSLFLYLLGSFLIAIFICSFYCNIFLYSWKGCVCTMTAWKRHFCAVSVWNNLNQNDWKHETIHIRQRLLSL